MPLTEHVRLMAEYNQWMNAKIYEAAATLSEEDLSKHKGAFFGSIIGTLNHIAVGDTYWLKRFSPLLQNHSELDCIRALNQPQALDEILFSDIRSLHEYRKMLDATFTQLAATLTTAELTQTLSYANIKGITSHKNLFSLFMHVFNHQTHHRGQITTLLSQAGVDVGVTDLVAIMPNV